MALTDTPTKGSATKDGHVPLFATRGALDPLVDAIAARQRAVLESGRYILGPEVEAFESEFAAFIGRRHCIGVANGTEALTIALRALGIRPGDEVVVPGVSFFATAGAVVNAGARPVFADIDPVTYCMSAATVEPVLTPRTRALLPVHLFGNPAPMDELMDLACARGLQVLEDSAQAAGASFAGRRAGGIGDAASFSFYPGKNLGGVGDGGAILTDDDEVARLARLLRKHGQDEPWVHIEVGYNSRLDELQAAALRVLLPQLPGWTEARRAAAQAYARAGIGELVDVQLETPGAESAYHLYVIRSERRDELGARLGELGIETRAYYTTPLNRQPALAGLTQPTRLESCEVLASQGLALPMGPDLDAATASRVVDAIDRAAC